MIKLMTEQNLENAVKVWNVLPEKVCKDMCVAEGLIHTSENPFPPLTPAQKFLLLIKYRSDLAKYRDTLQQKEVR